MATQDTRWIRPRFVLSILAGPATHVILMGLAIFVLGWPWVLQHVWTMQILVAPASAAMFLYANVVLLVANLVPRKISTPAGLMYSDGYLLIDIPFWNEKRLAEYRATYPGLEGYELQCAGKFDEAIICYEQALRTLPDNFLIRHDLAVAQLCAGAHEEARATFDELLNSDLPNPGSFCLLIKNNIAYTTAVMVDDDQERLEEADKYSEEALGQAPRVPVFQGTRGAVLVRLGRLSEGIKLLKQAYRRHTEPANRATCACWISVGQAHAGNLDEAQQWLTKAQKACPWLPLLVWAKEEVAIAQQAK